MPYINRQTVLKLAAHTIINCYELHVTAHELFKNKHYGLARSHAIFVKEELGKLIFSLGYLMGVVPPEKFLADIRSHPRKQVLGKLLAAIIPSIIKSAEKNISEIFNFASDTVAAASETLKQRINDFSDVVEPAIIPAIPKIEFILGDVLAGGEERLRQQGIYVSLVLENEALNIEHPRMVTREDAQAELESIEPFFQLVNMTSDVWKVAELDADIDSSKQLEKIVELLDQLIRPLDSKWLLGEAT